MKKLLNPKLAKENVTVIEDSSSLEKLEDSEYDKKEVMKGKKSIVSKDKCKLPQFFFFNFLIAF